MTASQIAHQLHGVKRGDGWKCHCPTNMHQHGDRDPSLKVWEADGWVRVKCWVGCTRDEILAAMGLKIRDLALNEFRYNPIREQEQRDRREFEFLEKAWPLAEWLSVIYSRERNYWKVASQNYFEQWYWMRCKLEPEWKRQRERESEVQRIIAEYGFDELWECLPERVL